MPCPSPLPDRHVAGHFGRMAAQYDRHADLQRLAARRLAALLLAQGCVPPGGVVAEIGCGTGLLTELLAPRLAHRLWLASDASLEMLAACRAKLGADPRLAFAVLDGENAALIARPDAIVSGLALQWLVDPLAAIARFARQTDILAFSLPLAGSFGEWEQAVADLGRSSGLLPLPEEDRVRAALESAGARDLVWRVEEEPRRFRDATHFVESLRRIGADRPRPGYRPGPIRPLLRRFADGLSVTVRLLYCIARGTRP